MKKYKPLLYSLLISLGAGALSFLLTGGAMDRYRTLRQPPLSPPGWLFPVVWTLLFLLMGAAAWLVWRSGRPVRRTALFVYGAQLLVNALWSPLFFGAQKYLAAFFWLVLLEILIGVTIFLFARADRRAALLMIPYFLWVLFAGYLNLGVWALNG
ncbi:MAG: TspO/MBR family protein [Clostridiaceae bacterium]|nr:TspO/MBR family protein [Clostridiaceae bacterium]